MGKAPMAHCVQPTRHSSHVPLLRVASASAASTIWIRVRSPEPTSIPCRIAHHRSMSADTADSYESLAELALNLRWSWNHSSDELWGRLDPDLWELTQNPWVILQTV